ncbi:hypothetical protein JCM11251_004867 [Rhodosporidiobolus azoricus]
MPLSPVPSSPPLPSSPSVIVAAPTASTSSSPPAGGNGNTSTADTTSTEEADDDELVYHGQERASWAQPSGLAIAAGAGESGTSPAKGLNGPTETAGVSPLTSSTTTGRRRSHSQASSSLSHAARRASLLQHRASEARRTPSAQWGDQSTSDDDGLYDGLAGGGVGALGGPRVRRLSSSGGGSRAGWRRSTSHTGSMSTTAMTPTPTLPGQAGGAASFPFATVSPFSRPASAVTRPGSTAVDAGAGAASGSGRPGSAATQRMLVERRAGWENGFAEEPEREREAEEAPLAGMNGHAHGVGEDQKGKGKEIEPLPAAPYVPPTPTNDPLDPLSSLRLHLAPSSSATPLASSPSRASSVHSASQLASTISRPRGPPPPALRPPDPHNSLHRPPQPAHFLGRGNGNVPFPSSYPSTESLASASSLNSTFAGPSSTASFPSNPSSSSRPSATQPQPSLQQLLQTVDLTAALKLVQTLQTQQTMQQKVAATAGAGTTTTTAVPAAGAVVEPLPEEADPQHPHPPQQPKQRLPPSGTFIDFADPRPPRLSTSNSTFPLPGSSLTAAPAAGNVILSPIGPGASSTLAASSSPLSPSPASPSFPVSPGAYHPVETPETPEKDREMQTQTQTQKKRDRRVSLLGFGKRTRTQSAVSKAASSAGGGVAGPVGGSEAGTPEKGKGMERDRDRERERERERERVLGERALLTEGGRTFEEEIAKVHLTLSPGTLRRAQNCAKYLSLRYTPLYAALSATDQSLPLPNPLEAARWRAEREEQEKWSKRSTRMGGDGLGGRFRGRLTSHGAADGRAAHELEGHRDALENARLGSTRLTEMGSAKAGGAPSPYGPRRNKNPGLWEVYPDDLADYVATSGQEAVKSGQPDAGASWRRRGGGPLSPREEKMRQKVDQLFHDPASAILEHDALSGGASGNDEMARVPTKASTASGGTGDAGEMGSQSPYLNYPPRPSTLSLSAGSASSVQRAGSTAQRSPRARPTSSFDSPVSRPSQQRQSSYEGSPYVRTTSFGNEPYPSSPLRRSNSLSTPAPPSPRSLQNPSGRPTSSIYALNQTSPRARLASAQLSKEDLPETAAIGPLQPNHLTSRHRHSASTEGFRHGLSRRFDRIRGRTIDGDASDFAYPGAGGRGGSFRRASDVLEHVPPGGGGCAAPSEGENRVMRSPSKRFGSPTLWSSGGGNGALSDSSRRQSLRPLLRKNATSVDLTRPNGFDSDAFVRSSGDEGSAGAGVWRKASRGLLANAWQGFKASRDGYPDHESLSLGLTSAFGAGVGGAETMLEQQRRREAEMHRRQIREEEEEDSEDEEEEPRRKRPPREVLDLGDDDFAGINSNLRQVRNDVSHLDTLVPQLPILLSNYLDELTAHETSTRRDARISIDYPYPRIPAAALAEIARVKEEHLERGNDGSGTESDTESNASSPSSSASNYSDSEFSDDSSDRSSSPARPIKSRRTRKSRHRSSDDSTPRQHARHVTEPVEQGKPQGRVRSHTLAYPPGASPGEMRWSERPKPNGRGSGFSPVQQADPLVVLERVLQDLDKTTTRLEDSAEKVAKEQEDVDGQIAAVVSKVDKAQKKSEQNDLQQLRTLEDHYYRLKTSLTRPSDSFDSLWAILSHAINGLFFVIKAVFKLSDSANRATGST